MIEVEWNRLEIGAYIFRTMKRIVDGLGFYRSECLGAHHKYDVNLELDKPVLMDKFSSKSNPALTHKVFKDRQGLYCTCTGFRTHGHCWHVSKVEREEGEQ